MRRTLIRYKTKPEAAERNADLVKAVFAELQAAQPAGVRYLTLRLEDDSFVHIVETAAEDGSSPIPKLKAFQEFQAGIRERCVVANTRITWSTGASTGNTCMSGRDTMISRACTLPSSIALKMNFSSPGANSPRSRAC